VHVVVLCQLPVASHVCTPLPMQRVVPGRQTPVHWPAPVHTFGQAAPLTQFPVASHVWGVVPLMHCMAPGLQTPMQRGVVVEQTKPQAVPSFWL
jgi:hypothetical protein